MRAGELRERITLRSLTVTDGPYGKSEAWTDTITVRGKVEHEGSDGAEKITVTLRYRQVGTDQRLTWKGNEYEITATTPDPRRRFVVLVAERELR